MAYQAPIQMVFFDAAGTLFNVRGSIGEIYARLARKHGLEAEPEVIEQAFAQRFRRRPPLAFSPQLPEAERQRQEKEWWRKLVGEVFAGLGEFPRFEGYFAELYQFFRTAEAWALYEDVEPTLVRLKERGLRLGIISNFDSRLEEVIRALELEHYFTSIHISSREGAAKPSPLIFRAAVKRNHLEARQAMHVGDSLREDVEGAAAAGLVSVWLDRSGNLTGAASARRIIRLDQLLELL